MANIPPTILIIGGVLLLLMIVGVGFSISREKSLVDERLESYMGGQDYDELEFGSSDDKEKTGVITAMANKMAERSSKSEKINEMLEMADMKLKAGEYYLMVIIASLGLGVLAWFLYGQYAALAGLVGGSMIPKMVVKKTQSKRFQNFNDQLADMLNLMVNGLRAGFSTMQALEAVSKELPAPISTEFKRVVMEIQLGITMEDAFENLLMRIPSEDLDLCITAINVQREVGGNLAEVLETISHTVRERVKIKGDIKTLTSQVVYSGRFLSMMPVILSFLLWAINPSYMGEFFLKPKICGYGLLACGGMMIFTGYTVMGKIADIEV